MDMLQFVCDYCGNIRQPQEVWITGLAAENVGTQAARREVVIDPAWTRHRAVLPFAVHFCSVECKDNYVAQLFDRPPELLEIERVEVVPGTGRVVQARKEPVKSHKAANSTATRRKAI